jgi:type VI secretion system (T6SS) effector TldE1-like protein
MPWTYSQSTGELRSFDGSLVAIGYSGHADGLNNPSYQNVPDVGPIPQGTWEIGAPYDSPEHGPWVLPLSPLEGTETFGRDEFKCHGDEVEHPGQHLASLGCIIMPRVARLQMWQTGDHVLQVVA